MSQAVMMSIMGVIPKLKDSCNCCSLKTGSFVTACLLLIGSSVQVGFYAFCVDHMYPQKMCTFTYQTIEDIPGSADDYDDYDYYESPRGFFPFPFFNPYHHYGRTGPLPENDAANSTNGDGDGNDTFPIYPRPKTNWFKWIRRRHRPRQKIVTHSYESPCVREHRPFEVHADSLDFDIRAPFDKTILYINIGIWGTMMAIQPVLMFGVYKDSALLVAAWLVLQSLSLLLGAASTVATAARMFGVVTVQIGIVTLLNLAVHLGIDVYFIVVVANYYRQLTKKEEATEEEEQNSETEQATA